MDFIVKTLLEANKVISVNKVLAFYVIWSNSVTQNVSLKHLDCYYSYVDLLQYIREKGNLREIEKFLVEYKIPYSISHVFSILSKDPKFHDDLFKFLNNSEVKEALKHYKMQKMDKSNIRYFIQCEGIRYCPKLLIKVLNRLR